VLHTIRCEVNIKHFDVTLQVNIYRSLSGAIDYATEIGDQDTVG